MHDKDKFGVDAVLCPPLKHNSVVRQDSYDDLCLDFTTTKCCGSTACDESTISSPPPMLAPVASSPTVVETSSATTFATPTTH